MNGQQIISYPARPVKGAWDPERTLPGEWGYESKLNGWRALLYLPTGALFNRHGKPLSIGNEFRWAVGELFARFGDQYTWLDVEALERRHTIMRGWLIVLDVVVPMRTYLERRAILQSLPELEMEPSHRMQGWVRRLPSYTRNQAIGIWDMMQLVNDCTGVPFYEGFVAKRLDSEYPIQTRSDSEETRDWVKMRFIFE